jgi:hypothetical protein
MLPVLIQDSALMKWFGGIDNANAWSTSQTQIENPLTVGPKKRKAMLSTAGPSEKKQKVDLKGKRKAL